MRLTELLTAAQLTGYDVAGDAEITSLVCDSRKAGPGACFVAIPGAAEDGHRYISAAIEAGCGAVICQTPAAAPSETPMVVLADTRRAVGPLAQALAGWPGRKLTTIGVTGTNGKTTVTWLLRQMLIAAGHRPGLLGTIHYQTGPRTIDAGTTTPGPIALAEMMAEMVAGGLTHLVMELSSHALDQRRAEGVDLAVGVMTNVSGDHLDYHGTMDNYLAAKLELFRSLSPSAAAIVNRDDPAGDAFAEATAAAVSWYGLSPAADMHGRIERIDIDGTHFSIITPSGQVMAHTPLIGRHNVFNCLAAASAAVAIGVEMDTIVSALAEVKHIPGRLQRVAGSGDFAVFVDYAHTDDAMVNVLGSLRPVTDGKLIVVFGCGGDRDRTKRPRMARAAEMDADRIVITSDNPRTEDPQVIIDEIVAGLSADGLSRSEIQPDRRAAIARGLAMAERGDVVLIAGKGHETYQAIGRQRIDFDDVQVARDIMGG